MRKMTLSHIFLLCLCYLLILSNVLSFNSHRFNSNCLKSSILKVNSDDDPDFNTRVRLKEESASPLRKLKYFFYLSAIAGGGLGFVTSLPQLIFAIQDHSDKLNTVGTNIAINLAGVAGGILLWIREYNDEKAKLDRFAQNELKLSNRLDDSQVGGEYVY